jgi:hypothetical protein
MSMSVPIREQLYHSSHQSLAMEAETVSEMLKTQSILTWLTTQEDFITIYSLLYPNLITYIPEQSFHAQHNFERGITVFARV